MKKLFAILALFGALSLGVVSTASAHSGACYSWKKVCKPVYKIKSWWGTCYKNGYTYKCKKKKRVHVGKKCFKKCVGWQPHNHHKKKYYKKKYYKKKHYNSY